MVVPFSAGVLLGVALFGLLPELALEAGWTASLLLFAAATGCCWPSTGSPIRSAPPARTITITTPARRNCTVCGAADRGGRAAQLPGRVERGHRATGRAAGVARGRAAGRGAAQTSGRDRAGRDSAGVGESREAALGWCVLAEGSTLAGGVLGLGMAPHLGTQWITYPLGIAAGWLFYLGYPRGARGMEAARRGAGVRFGAGGGGGGGGDSAGGGGAVPVGGSAGGRIDRRLSEA